MPSSTRVRGVEVGERLRPAGGRGRRELQRGTSTPSAPQLGGQRRQVRRPGNGEREPARAPTARRSPTAPTAPGASYADGGGTGTCSSLKKLRFAPACRHRARWSTGSDASAASSSGSRGADTNGSELPTPTTGSAHGSSVRAAAARSSRSGSPPASRARPAPPNRRSTSVAGTQYRGHAVPPPRWSSRPGVLGLPQRHAAPGPGAAANEPRRPGSCAAASPAAAATGRPARLPSSGPAAPARAPARCTRSTSSRLGRRPERRQRAGVRVDERHGAPRRPARRAARPVDVRHPRPRSRRAAAGPPAAPPCGPDRSTITAAPTRALTPSKYRAIGGEQSHGLQRVRPRAAPAAAPTTSGPRPPRRARRRRAGRTPQQPPRRLEERQVRVDLPGARPAGAARPRAPTARRSRAPRAAAAGAGPPSPGRRP